MSERITDEVPQLENHDVVNNMVGTNTSPKPAESEAKAGDFPYWHALSALRPFVSALRLRELVARTGSPRAAWEISDEFLQQIGWTEEQRTHVRDVRDHFRPDEEYPRLTASGLQIVTEQDEQFPALLREIYDPPLLLYVRGELPKDTPCVAVVGSRKATQYGKTATNLLVRPLASRGLTIVSGLAYGIDAEAHRATLAVHGRTIAVLGSGSDDAALYPRAHRQLAADIVAAGGAVITEYPPGTRPQAYFFPQRNRIIAGLSRALVVVEADEKSGALISARLALDQNRDVFAVPGPITSDLSRGTNALLRDGAAPARGADDILAALELQDALPAPLRSPTATGVGQASDLSSASPGDTGTVLTHLSTSPRGIDELVHVSTLAPNVVVSVLTLLELDGRIRDVGNKHYVRV